jgi:hypothetical protein
MTRINALRNIGGPRGLAWGEAIRTNIWGNINAFVFAALLIVCSLTVGCSSQKPLPISSQNQIPATQAPMPVQPASVMQAESKPAPKRVVHRKPATANYTDKTYGVTFEYPRRYAIETGDAAAQLLMSNPIPMNFVQAGGIALAAVELPETGFANTDFSSAFFNVSVNPNLTADGCNQFSVPQPKAAEKTAEKTEAKAESDATTAATASTSASDQSSNKLMLGDLELRGTEAVTGEGTRQSDSKYFHVFENGACYEFGLNVTTVASEEGMTKHVDRDKVFSRLEKILATVKIEELKPAVAPEVTAVVPSANSAPEATGEPSPAKPAESEVSAETAAKPTTDSARDKPAADPVATTPAPTAPAQ